MLYDPLRDERDACGIGFVADAAGRPSRAIVEAGLEALCRVLHRGAVAADSLTGDGAGLLTAIPRLLPGGPGAGPSGIAMTFLDPEDPGPGRAAVADSCAREGLEVIAWRPVPVDPGALGEEARSRAPLIEQALLARPGGEDEADAERRAFRARRRAEAAARAGGARLYIASLSFRTVTYKALCAADQLAAFYPDLADESFESWFAIFHQRYSTNTAPAWERAQPFRFLGHNGEINTIRGNVALMRAREGGFGSGELASEALLRPVVDVQGSDSSILDEALELLVRAGRSPCHAMSMLVPPAWEEAHGASPGERGFHHYHACLIEPWDGPAGLVFSDGVQVAAALDRNGLRPLRAAVCEDGWVACASEAGAVSTSGHGLVRRFRLGPGQMLCVDPERGVIEDADIKVALARGGLYEKWVSRHRRPCSSGDPIRAPGSDITPRQVAAGYTKEEMTVVVRPMAVDGTEPTSSMGDDTPQPPLARFPRVVFSFLKQRFAQVTNPPIDHLRERHVMSMATRMGRRAPLLEERADAAGLREYPSPVLFPSAVAELEASGAAVLDATWDVVHGPDGLEPACRRLGEEAVAAVGSGAEYLLVTDRRAGPEQAAVPSPLAGGAVHHALLSAGRRSQASIVVECDDARETHHVACLLTIGADAVCPRLVLESIDALATGRRLGGEVPSDVAQRRFAQALEEGLLKIMSKMGISTLDSYRSAQIIEALGLGPEIMDLCLPGVSSPLGGLSFVEIGADVINRHDSAWRERRVLANTGVIKFRRGGEHHSFDPDAIEALHATVGAADAAGELPAAHHLRRAVRGDDSAYERFAALVNGRPPSEPRDLLEMIPAGPPLPIDDVEPAAAIVRRFSTGAMSHGALSSEAHETLALALNMIGGTANSGEGGEAPERYHDARNCGIKQVASGRFGVTPAYLASARELQIKMAQGSKPGEGGQLPGSKVSVEIARLRHTVPGVALISPPPHHDIYSIEDLAQLIFDLKQANEAAAVSVKLVASEGVGTIAAGVVKGLADVVHISGSDGGTGASPLSSIKNAGMPWEIGLAEARAALAANGLRGRARLRVDGGMKTGRDVLIASLLGADEFSFGTAALVAEGCILVRTCHRNTCPVGIATQDPALRAKFAGTPEMVARYLLLAAEEVRGLLASLGLRSLEEATGRTDLLRQKTTGNPRADSLDLSALLEGGGHHERRHTGSAVLRGPRSELGDRLHDEAIDALAEGRTVRLRYPITTADRAVGARLGCALAGRRGPVGRGGRVQATFTGSAGQSFGAFLAEGIELALVGEANDYVCKGMGGGRVAIMPPPDDAGRPQLAGNTVLYGATGGQLFVAGLAGERFGVRNSGAVAVVEGTGDHACEYMTAGAVVILGRTGINLGAGMSGGEVYVFDPAGKLSAKLNPQLVAEYEPSPGQLQSLRRVIEKHQEITGSPAAREILSGWALTSRCFKRVAPVAEVARLEALFEGTAA